MPVQINEVKIMAVVNPIGSSTGKSSAECPSSSNSGTEAEIIEQIMEIIKEKKER